MKVNTKFKQYIDTPCNSGTPCNEIYQQFLIWKTKIKEKENKGIPMKDSEYALLVDFLKENNLKFFHLLLILFFRDGVIDEKILTAYTKAYKRVKLDYINRNDFTFEYKKKYEDVDFEKKFEIEKAKNRWVNIYQVMYQKVEAHFKENDFITFTQYVKYLLNDFGIYTDKAWTAILPYIRTNFILEPNEITSKKLEAAKKKNRVKRVVNKDEDNYLFRISFAFFSDEYKEFVAPFFKALQKNKIKFKELFIYELKKNRIIKEIDLSDEIINKIENFSYHIENVHDDKFYERLRTETGEKRKNIGFFIDKKYEESVMKIKGSIATFVRLFIFKKYGVYPSGEVMKIYISERKARTVGEMMKEIS